MARRKRNGLGEPDGAAKRPKIDIPDDFDSEAEFLCNMRRDFADDVSADKLNRDAGLEDLQFLVGDQWPSEVLARRNRALKPTLTINRLPAFVGQVIGSRRLNETDIKIIPDNGGTIGVARVREGLVRSIQKNSRAEDAYDNALFGGVAAGLGNFKIELVETTDDFWTQDIKIAPILDHFAVVWDRSMTDRTGKDAKHCFEIESMPKREFYRRWPWAQPSDVMTDTAMYADVRTNGWVTVENVRVVNFWRMQEAEALVALTTNGETIDITDLDGENPDDAAILSTIASDPKTGVPYVKEITRKFAEMYICSGMDILEGPYHLPIDRIPIFRVPGWETRIGDQMHRWGLIRHAKDPQRLHNYWRSVVAEKLMQTPRAVWVTSDTAIQGREQAWRTSHQSDDPLLIYNAEAGQKPERLAPAQMEDALLAQAEITSQDIKDVTNIHEANLGMPSNEVSGAAIQARQRVSDTGTIMYHDNLTKAIEECGRVTNQLIPVVYDTPRIIKVLGQDGQEDMQTINDIGNSKSIDITSGKYAVTATTGASYATKRIEQATAMMSFANAMPQVMALGMDLIVEAMDWPKAQELAERIRYNMDPGMLQPDEMTPKLQQKAQEKQSGQAMAIQAQMMGAKAKLDQAQSQTELNYARARNYIADANATPAKTMQSAVSIASQAADRDRRADIDAQKVAKTG